MALLKQINYIVNHKYFFKVLSNNIEDNSKVLELGAGKTSYLRNIGKSLSITALDIFQPSLDVAKVNNVYDEYICSDVLELENLSNPKSFDYVVAFDLIEHLEKEQGHKLIESMSLLAKKAIIIYTPNGFLPQEPVDGNVYQKHHSGWKYNEMIRLKFNVYGINGLNFLRGEYAKVRIKPAKLGLLISNISWIILKIFNLDRLCFSLLCIKKQST